MSHRLHPTWPQRSLPTLLALAVAFLIGAVPLRECRAADGGGVVLAGGHAHDGACCDGSAADAELHGCGCGHAHGPSAPSVARTPHDDPAPADGHVPCCADASVSILVTGAVIALPPAMVTWAPVVPVVPPAEVVVRRDRADVGPDPGDGPPDGVVAVVLLR